MSTKSQEGRLAKSTVAALSEKGIKVLALDFDKTIVSVHTAGYWRQGAQKLSEHVRPCFKALIEESITSEEMHTCIVTYSMQPGLIKDVLEMVLPQSDTDKVIVRANSKDWAAQQNASSGGPGLGKQQHIAWITTELFNRKHLIIEPHEILLLDDDIENVKLAEEFGHQAYEIPEDVTLQHIHDYVTHMKIQKRLDVKHMDQQKQDIAVS